MHLQRVGISSKRLSISHCGIAHHSSRNISIDCSCEAQEWWRTRCFRMFQKISWQLRSCEWSRCVNMWSTAPRWFKSQARYEAIWDWTEIDRHDSIRDISLTRFVFLDLHRPKLEVLKAEGLYVSQGKDCIFPFNLFHSLYFKYSYVDGGKCVSEDIAILGPHEVNRLELCFGRTLP